LGYVELFIIRVKLAIYYFLHFNKVRQVAARLRAKSAICDCLVACCNLFYVVCFKLCVFGFKFYRSCE